MYTLPSPLPDSFLSNIHGCFKERGAAWLENLPNLLEETAKRWNLTLLPPFSNLSFNYVTPVLRADGSAAVLKAGVPHPELLCEMEALKCFAGRGSVRIFEADKEVGVFVLERITPGTPLTPLANEAQDAQATSIAAQTMRNLWCPAPENHSFPHIADWQAGLKELRERFEGGTGPLPLAIVEEAERLSEELLASAPETVLLHGDFHHDNILERDDGTWVAIDPKGILGEPAFEPGAVIRNLWQDRHTIADPKRLIARRVYQFADELALDRQRIRGWGIAHSVLSAWWCLSDNMDCWQGDIEVAQTLSDLK